MYRLKNKKRFFTICAVALICFVALFTQIRADEPEQYRLVVVQAGDTLWEIAEEYKPEQMDTRKFMNRIKKANHMSSGAVYENQTLSIPDGG